MEPTLGFRFVKRVINADTIHARKGMILQQRWRIDTPTGDCNGCGRPTYDTNFEWRDVPVESE